MRETSDGPPSSLIIVAAGSMPGDVASIATYCQVRSAKKATDVALCEPYNSRMDPQLLRDWLKAALRSSELSQAALARALSAELHRDVDRSIVNKMVTGRRDIAGDELLAIVRITGVAAPGEEFAQDMPPDPSRVVDVPILGAVGTGDFQPPAHAREALAPRPVALSRRTGIFAFYVVGESMAPDFRSGELIYVDSETPPQAGDFVVFEAVYYPGAPPRRYFKCFAGEKDGFLMFKQSSPPATERFRTPDMKWIWRVIPKHELA